MDEFSILLLEPLNALCYAEFSILFFPWVRRILDEQTALLATVIVAVWPSFLAHTTQPLKESNLHCARTRVPDNKLALGDPRLFAARLWPLTGLGLVDRVFPLDRTRVTSGELMIAIGLLTAVQCLFRMLRTENFFGETSPARCSSSVGVIIPRAAMQFYQPALSWAQNRGVAAFTQRRTCFCQLICFVILSTRIFSGAKISQLQTSIHHPLSGRRFEYRYGCGIQEYRGYNTLSFRVPELIGLFAPFPNTWFATGLQTDAGPTHRR